MGQGLKGAPHTYSQFTDLTFGPLPKSESCPAFVTLIGDHGDVGFALFIDDHIRAVVSFEAMYTFLHEKYFLRVAFRPLSLVPAKSQFFFDLIDVIGFSVGQDGLRLSAQHRDRVANWPTLTCKSDVDDFIWLTPFL